MVTRALCVLALVTATARPVRADSPRLAEARRAIEDVRYDEARTLLEAALAEGGNSPVATAELHRLLANTLVVLGERALGERAYQRWLQLDPQASLPSTAPGKLRGPFLAAQAHVRAHGTLDVVAASRDERTIILEVRSNPDAFAVAARVEETGQKTSLGERGRFTLPAPRGPAVAHVTVLDERGNHLVELAVGAPGSVAPKDLDPRVERARPAVPFARRWTTWAIPAGVLAAVGGWFAYDATRAQSTLESIPGTRGEFFYADYEDALARRDRDRILAGAFFVAGGACAITAIVMLATRPAAVVTPTVSRDGAGVAFAARF